MGDVNKGDLSSLDIKEAEIKCYSSDLLDEEGSANPLNGTDNGFDDLWCPKVWDGLLCWPATPAGGLVSLPCPEYYSGFDPMKTATRKCLEVGDWYWSEDSNSTWTNYTQCFADKIPLAFPTPPSILVAKYIPVVKAVSQIGYSVSLVTLIIAFIILATFKGLRCPRNKLHMHLFISFMLRACSTLFVGTASSIPSKVTLTTSAGGMVFVYQHAGDWTTCRVITSLWQYFLLANYCWILMEGLYLHNLIFLALFTDSSSIALYIILGWGLPAVFVIPWIFMRITWENTLCWRTASNPYYILLIRGPTTVSILVSFGLFLNIIRVLLLKLRASVCEENKKFRKWAKSTMVLVPLFGVHYVIFIGMSYVKGSPELELTWLFGDQLFASFQGFFVAVLYCFLNGEVRTELKKKWRRWYHSPYNSRNVDNPYSMQAAVLSCLHLVYPGNKERFNDVRGVQDYGKNESGYGAESCVMSSLVSIPVPATQVNQSPRNENANVRLGVNLGHKDTENLQFNGENDLQSTSTAKQIVTTDHMEMKMFN